MEPSTIPAPEDLLSVLGPDRSRYWARRLGRLRLGAEPLSEQLARSRRVTWALTAVSLGVGALFLGLFSGFGRPDLGAVVVGLFVAPIVASSWLGDWWLRRRVAGFEAEVAARHAEGRTG